MTNGNGWLLPYVLGHLEREHAQIELKIAMVRRELKLPTGPVLVRIPPAVATAAVPHRHVLSEASRRKMARAQQRRWQAYRRAQGMAATGQRKRAA